MSVKKVWLTEAGARVSAYAMLNNIAVNFTKFAIGSGENYNPSQATAMAKEDFQAVVTSVQKKGGNYWKVRGAFRNDELKSDLTFRELGLYVSDPENNDEEVLYCYGNAKGDDFDFTEIIPAFTTSGNVATRILDIDVYVQGDSATYFIDDTAKVDIVTVQELRDDLTQEIEERKNAIIDIEHGGTGETSQGAINKNIAKIIPSLDNDPTDDSLLVMRGSNDTLTNTSSFFTRKVGSVWNYIKSKISSVLGLTETSYGGNSATADIAKAPISARAKISTFNEEKPYVLLAKFKDSAVSNNDMNLTFYVLQETIQTQSKKILYIMNLSSRWSNGTISWLDWECLYSATGKNPDLTLVYNLTAGADMQFEIYGKFTTSYQQWRIIPIINSSGDYGTNPLSLHKWTYSDVKGTGDTICVALPTVHLPNVKEMTNPTSPVVHGLATKAAQDSTGQQIDTTYIKDLSASEKTITYTKGDGTTGTLTTQDTVYTHPTTSGNKHIPSGGANNQVLGYSADGTAQWTGRHDFIYTCSTATATAAKTVSITGFKLETGVCVRVLFSNGNSVASPTLNINSTGAKEIRVQRLGGSISPLSMENGGRSQGAYKWNSNTVLELMYNGTYWVAINNPVVQMSIKDGGGTLNDDKYFQGNSYKVYLDGYKEQWGYIHNTTTTKTNQRVMSDTQFDIGFYDKFSYGFSMSAGCDSDPFRAIVSFKRKNGYQVYANFYPLVDIENTTIVVSWQAQGY